jgi:hypothetical protein
MSTDAANRVTEKDLFGRFYLKKIPDEGRFKNYYASLGAVRPLLKSERWIKCVSGYYLNAVVMRDAVRVSFFTTHPDETTAVVEKFLAESSLEYSEEPERCRPANIAEPYGGEELRFRKFLCLYPLIGLDIMQENLLYSQCLFMTFRYQFMKTKRPYEQYFGKAFNDMSRTYRSLSEEDRKQFWLDMNHWPNPPQVDWMHMMVNMILGCDINSFGKGKWQEFISSDKILNVDEINEVIKKQELGFEIPADWSVPASSSGIKPRHPE